MTKKDLGILEYHYTSLDSLIKILTSGEIWASNIHYLNDGSEFAYALELARHQLLQIEQTNSRNASMAAIAREALARYDRVNVFVASFSEQGDLLSQWRAYCPIAKGVSIGIDTFALEATAAQQGFKLLRCIYDSFDQQQTVKALVKRLMEQREAQKVTSTEVERKLAHRFAEEFAKLAPQLKAPAFAEEHERRLVSGILSLDDSRVEYREGRSFVVPYVRFKLPRKAGKLQLGQLIVGPTPHAELAYSAVSGLVRAKGAECGDIAISQVPYRPW